MRAAVQRAHAGTEPEHAVGHRGQRAERHLAAALQAPQQRALGGGGEARLTVIQRQQPAQGRGVRRARAHADHAL